MRQLHVVAVTSDGKSLLLAGAAKGARPTHKLAVDKRLRAALAGELYAESADGDRSRQESALSPREMQARLRAGQTVEEVARAAGVSVDRVEPYAGPVESERQQVIDDAQAAVMERPRWGTSARTLGDAVIANLAAVSSLRPESVEWTTRRRQDGCWVVRLEFVARGRRRVAEWEWHAHDRTPTPIDHLAASIGYVAPRSRAQKSTTRKSTARKSTARKSTARKTAVRKSTARKSTARKSTARKTTARKTTARKTTARKTTAQKTAGRRTTAKKTTGRTTARAAAGRRGTGGRGTTRRR
ncbi:MAG: septation protein SepH [Actinomycetes bacterium]